MSLPNERKTTERLQELEAEVEMLREQEQSAPGQTAFDRLKQRLVELEAERDRYREAIAEAKRWLHPDAGTNEKMARDILQTALDQQEKP